MCTITCPCEGQQRCDCVQVHHPPYLFEAFLFQPVDDAASTARVTHTCVSISLSKKTSGLWKGLVSAAGTHTHRPRQPGYLSLRYLSLCFRGRREEEAEGASSAELPGQAVLRVQLQGPEQAGGQQIRAEDHDEGNAGRLCQLAAANLTHVWSHGSWKRKNETESRK